MPKSTPGPPRARRRQPRPCAATCGRKAGGGGSRSPQRGSPRAGPRGQRAGGGADAHPSGRHDRGVVLMKRPKGVGVVATDQAPKAIGPYSQAVEVNGVIYTAGQVALDPKNGSLVGTTAAEQTEQVLKNLAAVLGAAGASLQDVVKTTVYLADMGDLAAMNEVYAKYFGKHKPARSTVQAARLPRDARVEIDAIAVKA